MATVRNKTNKPLRVRIGPKKVLHLGPRQEGKVSDHDLDYRGVKGLVEAEELEILGNSATPSATGRGSASGHEETHGHHPATSVSRRGDR